METLLIVLVVLSVASLAVSLAALIRAGKKDLTRQDLDASAERTERSLSAARQEINQQTRAALADFSRSQSEIFRQQDQRISDLTQNVNRSLDTVRSTVENSLKASDRRLAEMTSQQEKNAEALRGTVDVKLREIRQNVEEKLQATLEDRISRSFKEVSDRLEQVYKGLGEMQTLASGVGDLKKVLSNVKTRGILGEVQLGAILEEILLPEQYRVNTPTFPGATTKVEFAVVLPGDGEGEVLLPIDSKFPVDAYVQLQDAYESCDPDGVKAQKQLLENRIKAFAKDIHTKYVSPPHTTDFAIMFLPTEGLYAEVVRMGMIEKLQKQYKINIAGPTTMAALLNSLQTGFRTLAIQKRSSEVWEVLAAVRTEFDKFEGALKDAQNKLDQAGRGLDALVGVRTRQIQRKLKNVSALPSKRAEELLSEDNDAEE